MKKSLPALLACVICFSSATSILVSVPLVAHAESGSGCCANGSNQVNATDCDNYCFNSQATANKCVGSYTVDNNPNCVCNIDFVSCSAPASKCLSNSDDCSSYCSTISTTGCYCQGNTFTTNNCTINGLEGGTCSCSDCTYSCLP